MADGDGNGWVVCRCGHRHWGRYGAAGLFLLVSAEPFPAGSPFPSDTQVLLQHRALWSHQGGTWGLPGGARDSHEDAVTTALREAMEETGIDAAGGELLGLCRTEHIDWAYETVLLRIGAAPPTRTNRESLELRWVALSDVPELTLHSGFAAVLPTLTGRRARLVVRAAEVLAAADSGAASGSSEDNGVARPAGSLATLLAALSATIVGRPIPLPTGGSRHADGDPGANALESVLVAQIEVLVEPPIVFVTGADPGVLAVDASRLTIDRLLARVGPGDVVVTADPQLVRAADRLRVATITPGRLLELLAAGG